MIGQGSGAMAALAQLRQGWAQAMPMPGPAAGPALHNEAAFGPNPGQLRMMCRVPPGPGRTALVVALHGCGQTAAGYAEGSGWAQLAERHGFALLLPEQDRANNAQTCFNWFEPDDITRGHGEAASVRAMVQHMVDVHGIDPARIFVTGLSAGGAFANVMLATYPELFAAGAIVAGLPYGAARTLGAAIKAMHHPASRAPRDWGDLVRAASGHGGRWPVVSIWQGEADAVVRPDNATAIARQWLDVHGVAADAAARDHLGPASRLRWARPGEAACVELVTVPGMGHGVPISAQDPDPALRCGQAGAFMLETGLSSSALIAQSWGLAPAGAGPARVRPAAQPASLPDLVGEALRRAGLMR